MRRRDGGTNRRRRRRTGAFFGGGRFGKPEPSPVRRQYDRLAAGMRAASGLRPGAISPCQELADGGARRRRKRGPTLCRKTPQVERREARISDRKEMRHVSQACRVTSPVTRGPIARSPRFPALRSLLCLFGERDEATHDSGATRRENEIVCLKYHRRGNRCRRCPHCPLARPMFRSPPFSPDSPDGS
jgi:hypothetical protein